MLAGLGIAAAFLLFTLIFTNEYGSFLYLGGFDLIDIACAALLLAILDGRWGGNISSEFKPFVAMGMVSYAFYLWHLPVFAIRYFDAHCELRGPSGSGPECHDDNDAHLVVRPRRTAP